MKKRIYIILALFGILICGGCGKASGNNIHIFGGAEQSKDNTDQKDFSLEEYKVPGEDGLYDIGSFIENIPQIVFAGFKDDKNIVIVRKLQEEDNWHLQVNLLSLDTGKETLISDILLDDPVEKDDGVTVSWTYSYEAVSISPLILYSYDSDSYFVFNEDYTAVNELAIDMKNTSAYYLAGRDSLAVFNTGENKVYEYNIEEYLKPDAVTGSQKNILTENELLWAPEVNMGSAYLSAVSDDGNYLALDVQDLTADDYTYVDIVYNIATGEYEAYKDDDFYAMAYDFDYSWDLDVVFDDVTCDSGIVYRDYNQGREYQIYPDLSKYDTETDSDSENYDEEDYGYDEGGAVWIELNKYSKSQGDYILYEIEDADISAYTDIMLWDYQTASYTDVEKSVERNPYYFTEEIDYGKATETANEMEEKYGIQIIIGDNVKNQFPDYTAETVTDEELILDALSEIDNSLQVYPDGFLEELTEDTAASINIYLVGTLTPIDAETYISDASAVTSLTAGYHMMVFDITQWGIGQNLIHEMSHVIDNKLMDMGLIDELNEQWSECNPEGFEYYDSYMGYEGDWTYTAYSDEYYEDMDAEKIYFYDDYAKTYPGEDRARIMENFYDWDWVESYYNSSHFQAKIGIYLDFLEAHFDTCRDGNYKWRDMYERLIKEGI